MCKFVLVAGNGEKSAGRLQRALQKLLLTRRRATIVVSR